jgi:hypothetical protein
MANTYSDLTATNVAYNYGKTTPTTQLGTRVIRFVKVTISGGTPPDLTTKDGSGSYTDSQSYYNALVRTMSDYAEIYAMFIPSSTIAVFAIADDTAQDSDTNTNVAGGWGDFEANALAALGSWGSGAVAVTTGTWAGATISWA